MSDQEAKSLNLKKKILVVLLLASSIIAWLLLTYDDTPNILPSHQLSEIDSLIYSELNLYNISSRRISREDIQVNPEFTRSNLEVSVPRGISRTWIHSELTKRLHGYNVRTYGTVSFPERDLDIRIIYRNTLIRRIHLRNDTTTVRPLQLATMMVYFDQRPDINLIRQIDRLGEPIPVVLRARTPQQAQRWHDALPEDKRPAHFWIIDEDYAYPGASFNTTDYIATANALKNIRRRPVKLYFPPVDNRPNSEFFNNLRQNNIRIVTADNVHLISDRNGRFAFDQEFRRYAQSAIRGERPKAIIRLSPQTTDWLQKHLNDMKKGGVVLMPVSAD